MSNITIDHEKCENINCGECVDVCPMEVLVLKDNKILIQNEDECSQCETCVDVCPNECIIMIY